MHSSASSNVSGGRIVPAAAPASSCRRRADRSAAGCGRRRPRPRARGARSSWPRTSARSPSARGRGGCGRDRGRHERARPRGWFSASTASGSDRDGADLQARRPRTPRRRSAAAAAAAAARAAAPRRRSAARRGCALIAPSSESSPSTTVSSIARRVERPGRGEQAERDRQIERRARLAHVGRRQVDGDAVRRKLEAGVPDRRAHAVAALAHGRVGQPDHREVGQPERHVHFDVHRIGVDAEDGGAAQAGEHGQHVQDRRQSQAAESADSSDLRRASGKLRCGQRGQYAVRVGGV